MPIIDPEQLTRMNLDERIETALLAQDCDTPLTAAIALVHALHAEGLTKQAIADAYNAAYQRHDGDDDATAYDALGDVLHCLTGWCPAKMRLLPDEPDVTLS